MSLKSASYYLRYANELKSKAAQCADVQDRAYFRNLAAQYEKQAEIAARFESQ